MIVTFSRGLALLATGLFPAQGGCSRGTLGPVLFALAIHPVIQEARLATERSFPSGLDICSFHLDDGLCAGDAPGVSFFLEALVRGLGRIGLVVNLSKTEVIPPCTSSQSFGPDSFPGCSWNGAASWSSRMVRASSWTAGPLCSGSHRCYRQVP